MRRTTSAAVIAVCLALSGCAGDGFDERFPSVGAIPPEPVPMPNPPKLPPMGETNIAYNDVELNFCQGVISVHNSLDVPAGIEVEVTYYTGDNVSAVRRYAWWPAKKGAAPLLPAETLLQPDESKGMELVNDGMYGYNGPFEPAPTGCRVTGAHLEPNPTPRPCTEKHGTDCKESGRPGRTLDPEELEAMPSLDGQSATGTRSTRR